MLIGFEEKLRELNLLELWREASDTDVLLTTQELKELVEHPPQLCDEPSECVSRHLSGNNCICIRSVFKNQKQFNQWKLAFETAVKEKLFVGVDITDIET
jgi:hypothetical protein